MLGLMMGVAMVTMMVLPVGVMGDLAMGRIGVAEDPTTSGRSHLLQGRFWGYRYSAEIRNHMNSWPFCMISVPSRGASNINRLRLFPLNLLR